MNLIMWLLLNLYIYLKTDDVYVQYREKCLIVQYSISYRSK